MLAALGLVGCSAKTSEQGGNDERPADSQVGASSVTGPALSVAEPPRSQLAFSVRDADTHALIPCKLTFLGVHGSHDPMFSRTDRPRYLKGGSIAAFSRIFSLSGAGAVRLPRGRYDVYVSRGPEWSLYVRRDLRVGVRGVRLDVELEHVVDSSGWISGDFHVHAAPSYDSRVPMSARVYEFASDGVEILVSADHNVISDYGPIIRRLGAERYIASGIGSEITTHRWGHFGAFPLQRFPRLPKGGAFHVGRRTPAQLFAAVRERSPRTVIEVNHPRLDRMAYFKAGRLDSAHARFKRKVGTSFDFDAIELFNGYASAQRQHAAQVMQDWFNLIDHGLRFTATGNSDTHHLRFNLGGFPRNYLRVADDRPEAMTPDILARTVKAGRCFFTTGPFVRVDIAGGQEGDTVEAPNGHVPGTIKVQAAPWIDVSSVTLFVDGHADRHWAVPPGRAVNRFETHFDEDVARDAYFVVRVRGKRPLTPVVGMPGGWRVTPMALTNPVYVDVDGNGRYDAPLAGQH